MKVESLQQLTQHLKKGASYPVYLIVSKEEYDRKEGLKQAISHLFPQESPTISHFDGEKVRAKSLFSELNALSLFSEKKAVVIDKGEKLKIDLIHQLESYCKAPNPTSSLVIVAESLSTSTKFFKLAASIGVAMYVRVLKPWEKEKMMPQWIAKEVGRQNKKIDPQACQMIVRLMGADRMLVEQELEKLICYVGDRVTISANDVTTICSSVPLESVWKLGDSIFECNGARAVKIGREMLDDGVHLLALLKQIRYQFESKFQLCSLIASGANREEIGNAFPNLKGGILQQNEQMARRYGMGRFKRGLLLIDETELQAKNSGYPQSLLMELLLTKLTQ